MQLTTLIAIAAASSVSACGKASTSSETSAGAPAAAGSAATDCAYISASQLSSIEGDAYAAPTIFNGMCNWAANNNVVTITVRKNATDADWQAAVKGIESDQRSGSAAPIVGLGDRAAGVGLEIAVQRGGVVIDIRNGDSPGFGKWPKSTAIANAIIAGVH